MRFRRRQVVDMTLRGGHGPHTADWRATRDKETLEVDMQEFVVRNDKYKYPVVDVVMALHSHFTGTGDPLGDDSLQTLVDWLTWRTSEGWDHSDSAFDHAVLNLARICLHEANHE